MVCYSSAGHLPAIVADADGGRRLLDEAQSLPLAVRTARRRESTTSLPAGSVLLLYTDGLVARRGDDLDVGIDRAVTALSGGRQLAADTLIEHLHDCLLTDGHDDDVAYLVHRAPTERDGGGPPAREPAAVRPESFQEKLSPPATPR